MLSVKNHSGKLWLLIYAAKEQVSACKSGTQTFTYSRYLSTVFQEDISKLRRKIEKAKKPAEKISNGDDILNEEINDYKVGFHDSEYSENVLSSFLT